MQSVEIGKNQAGQRLDKFLHKYLPQAGTGFLYKMLRKKNITLNGKKAMGSEMLVAGDEVCCFFSPETFAKFSGLPLSHGQENAAPFLESPPISEAQKNLVQEAHTAYGRLEGISILYEDEDFLFLNKPAGILAQKAKAGDLSLNEWLTGYLLEKVPAFAEELSTFRPAVCNRLDRNTSGIVLCGKSLAGLQYLGKCIRDRRVRKFYHTVCVGRMEETLRLEGFLCKDGEANKVTVLSEDCRKNPKNEISPICTVCRPLGTAMGHTLLEVELITGKSHQIRAHLASIGHPLIGDAKYGSKEDNLKIAKKFGLKHQLLHACRVEFPEALSDPGKRLGGMCVHASKPEEFLRLQKALGL